MSRLGLRFVATVAIAAASPAAAKDVVSCAGGFARDASHAAVLRAFGARNVVYRRVHVPDDEHLKASVVFPRDAARKVEIIWAADKARRRPYMVTFGPGWRTAEGITVGATLEAVETINGGAFTLAGFNWDYSGTVTDWNGGALARRKGGCRLVVRFEPARGAPAAAANAVSGDGDFSSRDANMRAVAPKVYQIAIMYD
jgi:hypothetical protein